MSMVQLLKLDVNNMQPHSIPVLRIRIRWIRKILASWIRIRIRKNMRIHGSGAKGQNINQKLQKKNLISKPKSEL